MKPLMPLWWDCGGILVSPVCAASVDNPAIASHLCILLLIIPIAIVVHPTKFASRTVRNHRFTAHCVNIINFIASATKIYRSIMIIVPQTLLSRVPTYAKLPSKKIFQPPAFNASPTDCFPSAWPKYFVNAPAIAAQQALSLANLQLKFVEEPNPARQSAA